MPRAGLTALATMMSAFPGAQQNVQTALATREERSMRSTRFGQEQDQYKLIKDTMLKDEKWIDNLYDWVKKNPVYSKYADLLPDRTLYSNDMKGKESANGEVAKLKYMVDKYEQAKQMNPNFSVTPNLAYDRKDWQSLYSNALAPTMKQGQAASEYAMGAQEQGGPEGATSEMARQNIGVLQNQEALATKAMLAGTQKPMTEGASANLALDQAKFQRQLEQDYEDAVVKLTNVKQNEKKAWEDKKKAEKDRENWLKKTSTGEETYLKSTDDKMKADVARLDKTARDIMNQKTTLELNTQRVKEKAKLVKKDAEKNQPKKKDLNVIF